MKIKNIKKELLDVHVFDDRQSMGEAAAQDAAGRINRIIEEKGEANVIFAAAPSQNDLTEALKKLPVDWTKVRAFQQDEYIGITEEEPSGFGNFLKAALYDHISLKEIYSLLTPADKVDDMIASYTALLSKYPPDLIFLGVGENGHLAFNDPPVADFDDPYTIKVVELDGVCRQQQVNDGCFLTLDDVPTHALTLTLSLIRSVPEAICVVPTGRKAEAINCVLNGPLTTECPASMLRLMENAALYLARDSAALALPEVVKE